jgi:hypothetical protein
VSPGGSQRRSQAEDRIGLDLVEPPVDPAHPAHQPVGSSHCLNQLAADGCVFRLKTTHCCRSHLVGRIAHDLLLWGRAIARRSVAGPSVDHHLLQNLVAKNANGWRGYDAQPDAVGPRFGNEHRDSQFGKHQ